MTMSGTPFSGQGRKLREPIEVPESRTRDKSIDKLLAVQGQRMSRLERERLLARQEWRQQRTMLRQMKTAWRRAARDTAQYWEDARASFFSMAITSTQFRRAKEIYDRMKAQTAQLRLELTDMAKLCRRSGQAFFRARRAVQDAYRRQEKLGMLRDELQLLHSSKEI